jgi:hypothetical protein
MVMAAVMLVAKEINFNGWHGFALLWFLKWNLFGFYLLVFGSWL